MRRKAQKKKSFFANGIVKIAIMCFAVYIAFTMISSQVELSEKRKTKAELEEQKIALSVSNEEKKMLIEKSDDNEFIERIAREYYDYAYPDEQVFIDISGS